MIMKLFDHWGLSLAEQAGVLGLRSIQAIRRYRSGRPIANQTGLLERVSCLLAIHGTLHTLYPRNRRTVYAWIVHKNDVFLGQTPLDVILREGMVGLRIVREYLEFQRDR